jgi:aspartate aminotransferase
VAQHAGLAALTGPQEPFERMIDAYEQRRRHALDRVSTLPALNCVEPEGAFYLFCKAEGIDGTSVEVATILAKEYGVSVAPGSGFGEAGEGFFRISYATSTEQLDAGFDRIERFLRERVEAGG